MIERRMLTSTAPLTALRCVTVASNLGYQSVHAGDVNEIRIGENTNIQDGVIVHVARNNAAGTSLPTIIGNNVTIGE